MFAVRRRSRRAAPSGSKHQNQDQDRERDDVLEGGIDEGDGEALDDAEHEPAEHGAPDVADAAEHRRGERLEPGRVAHDEVDLRVIEADQHAGRAAERRAEEEGERRSPADVDAHDRRHLAVLGDGADRSGRGVVRWTNMLSPHIISSATDDHDHTSAEMLTPRMLNAPGAREQQVVM